MRPPLVLNLVEVPRMAGEIGEYAAHRRRLGKAPHGDGHPVLVLPGLLASDGSTTILRNYLTDLGYQTHGWGAGFNIGPTRRIVDLMRETVESLAVDGPISLVGWSLGGLYARHLARSHPEQVRQVITLAAPFRIQDPEETRAALVYEHFQHLHIAPDELERERGTGPLLIPATSIYSRTDGVVPWTACLEELNGSAENIEIKASHLGMGHHPAALWAVADRLAQPVGQWQPFAAPRELRRWYPEPARWPLRFMDGDEDSGPQAAAG